MIVHKYKNLVGYKRIAVSHCGVTLPMAIKESKWGDGKPIPPPNCLNDETKITCSSCINIMIGIYKAKIGILEQRLSNSHRFNEPQP